MTTSNRDLVMEAVTRFSAGDVDAFLELLDGDFVSHNPGVRGPGSAAFGEYLRGSDWLRTSEITVKRVVADADHVAVHTHIDVGQGPGLATIDLFRVHNGRIVEHWDVIQQLVDQPVNPNAFF
ncbi:nuclear transport factor 2 family protein [Kribbella sp. NPDC055110]